ncbi:Gfo/Idh/MocA family oxidoreductase [bacterium]|nr:Gfo/Idh/MocA family oxidoreductase [bacterium]
MPDRTARRREFLKMAATSLGGALAVPSLVRSSALGADGATAPSDRTAFGVIGYGGRCRAILGHFMAFGDARCLAVSDCNMQRRHAAKARVDQHNKNTDCGDYPDFRDLLARDDIDAVLIATGDRWHTPASIYAARAGKDIYTEKPISLSIAEGRAMADTMKRFGTIYQAGHQRRSVDSYRFQNEAVRTGAIGKLHTIHARMWAGPRIGPQAPQPVPKGLDYDMWLGPTPWHPYTNARVGGWNYFWDTGAGPLIGMGCHYTDIAQWGHDSDDTGPIEYRGTATWDLNAFSDTPITADITCTYADGVKLLVQSQGAFADRFIRFIGDKGWIQVDDQTNLITASPASILKQRAVAARSWAHTGGHVRNWLDCIKSRQPTVCHPESAQRATTICHVLNIGLRLGRPVRWDPSAERFVGDDEANRMISRAYRAPWAL